MTTTKKILIVLAALSALGAAAVVKNQLSLPMTRVTVRVVDEGNQPVEGANVILYFKERDTGNDLKVAGKTDPKGEFTGEGGKDGSKVHGSIKLDGYHPSGVEMTNLSQVDEANRVLPWNDTYTAVLREKVKPVPLYARRLVKLEIPVLDNECGYDLMVADWVAPWGKGATSDFIFKATREYKDVFNFAIAAEIKFSNPKDGFSAMKWNEHAKFSSFKWERLAPETGYVPSHKMTFIKRDPRKREQSTVSFDGNAEDVGYFFRVRSIEKDGQILFGLYGKVTGEISIDARNTKTVSVNFTYYLNPSMLDRNLEWDKEQNLFKGLTTLTAPRLP